MLQTQYHGQFKIAMALKCRVCMSDPCRRSYICRCDPLQYASRDLLPWSILKFLTSRCHVVTLFCHPLQDTQTHSDRPHHGVDDITSRLKTFVCCFSSDVFACHHLNSYRHASQPMMDTHRIYRVKVTLSVFLPSVMSVTPGSMTVTRFTMFQINLTDLCVHAQSLN